MNVEYEKIVGSQVKAMRLAAHLSQEQLAAKLQLLGCDITRSALAKIEVGQRHIYVDELQALKLALKITYEQLLIEV